MKLAPQKSLAESYFSNVRHRTFPEVVCRSRCLDFSAIWQEPRTFLLQFSITNCSGQLLRVEEQGLERNREVDARVGLKVEIDDRQGRLKPPRTRLLNSHCQIQIFPRPCSLIATRNCTQVVNHLGILEQLSLYHT